MEKIKKILLDLFANWKKGLTWQKILLSCLVVLFVASGIVWTIDPHKQFVKMRNGQRREDVNLILNAVYQYSVDNQGNLPSGIEEEPKEICKPGANCEGLLDLSNLVLKKKNKAYLSSMPVDPNVKEGNGTGYVIRKNGNRISVAAPGAEQGATVSSTR